MRRAWLSLVAVPAFASAALLFGLAGGAKALEEGTCTYNSNDGTCSSTDCGVGSDPHKCQYHSEPNDHCDCVPKSG